jgi:hypothetical protein
MPEVPGYIQDPPPRHYPSPTGLLLVGVFGLVVGLSFALFDGTAPTAASIDVAAPPSATEPDVMPLLDRGLEALAHGEVDLALASYRAACTVDPARPEAHRGRGLAATRAGLDGEAISAFEHYLALAPDAPDTERVRARITDLRAHRAQQAQ